MIDKFAGHNDWGFFAIYDGHGGREVVEYVAHHLHQVSLQRYYFLKSKSFLFIITNSILGQIFFFFLLLRLESHPRNQIWWCYSRCLN